MTVYKAVLALVAVIEQATVAGGLALARDSLRARSLACLQYDLYIVGDLAGVAGAVWQRVVDEHLGLQPPREVDPGPNSRRELGVVDLQMTRGGSDNRGRDGQPRRPPPGFCGVRSHAVRQVHAQHHDVRLEAVVQGRLSRRVARSSCAAACLRDACGGSVRASGCGRNSGRSGIPFSAPG